MLQAYVPLLFLSIFVAANAVGMIAASHLLMRRRPTVSLLGSSLRRTPLLADGEYLRSGPEDDRFVDYSGTIQSIVTSTVATVPGSTSRSFGRARRSIVPVGR